MSDINISEAEGIVTITLNRPDKLNALVGHMRRDLAEALEQAGSDRLVRVVVITGAGRGFCAGGDLERASELMDQNDSEEFARLLGAARRRYCHQAYDETRRGFHQRNCCRGRLQSRASMRSANCGSERDLHTVVRKDWLSS